MPEIKISIELARRMALSPQLLDGRTKLPKGKEGIIQAIDRLGYVQIDPMAAIKPTHHHTLWTRCPDYQEEMLYELQAKECRVFEYWTHAQSYIPISDYRYYLRRMQNFHHSKNKFVEWHVEKSKDALQPVLECIRREGPQNLKDLTAKLGTGEKIPGRSEPFKTALNLLFWQGVIMVSKRVNSEKTYDLTERVLPDGLDLTPPSKDDLGRFLARRALTALGLAQEKEIHNYLQPGSARDASFQAVDKAVIARSLSDLVDTGEVITLHLQDDNRDRYYAWKEVFEYISSLKPIKKQVFLLSPFDNLIIQRDRTKRLFGFEYALECYVPAAHRKYGYYVLPILWGEQLVGRFDPKADRKHKILILHNLIFEPGFTDIKNFLPVFADKLTTLAQFNQCNKIEVRKSSPDWSKRLPGLENIIS